jgi:hypothetical protein
MKPRRGGGQAAGSGSETGGGAETTRVGRRLRR